MTLKQIAEKYNFRYEKNYKVDWNKKRDENNADVFIPLTEALLAKIQMVKILYGYTE